MRFTTITLSVLLSLCVHQSVIATQSSDLEQLEALLNAKKHAQVIDTYERLTPQQLTPELTVVYIRAVAKTDLDDAEDAATTALKTFPNNPDMYSAHANVMLMQAMDSVFSALGYAEKAINSMKKAVSLAPNEIKYRKNLMGFYLGAPSIAGGDTDLALIEAQAIVNINPREGSVAMSRYYYAIDEKDNAISSIVGTDSSYLNDPMLLNQLANIYVMDEDYSESIKTYEKIASMTLPNKPADAANNPDLLEQFEQTQYFLLNSHYQIGRLALETESSIDIGLQHLQKYINLYDEHDVDADYLPTKDWAFLRLAGLQLLKKDLNSASDSISKVDLSNSDDNMEKTHKKLLKKIKRALKKQR